MLNSKFLLSKLTNENYFSDPFPHIIIENCIDNISYKSLTDTFPSYDLFNIPSDANNKRSDIFSKDIINSNKIHNNWYEFFKLNNSNNFTKTILDFFYKDLIKIYPKQFLNKNDIDKLNLGINNENNYDQNKQLLIEMSLAINSPVKKMSAVRNAHLDKPKKLFTALYYMRENEDESTGGDLILYKWRSGYSLNKKRITYHEALSSEHIIEKKIIKYSSNKLIVFLNSIDSLHAVSPRSITNFYRKFCCITCSSEKQFNSFNPTSKIEKLKLQTLNKLKLL